MDDYKDILIDGLYGVVLVLALVAFLMVSILFVADYPINGGNEVVVVYEDGNSMADGMVIDEDPEGEIDVVDGELREFDCLGADRCYTVEEVVDADDGLVVVGVPSSE